MQYELIHFVSIKLRNVYVTYTSSYPNYFRLWELSQELKWLKPNKVSPSGMINERSFLA